MTDDIKRQLAEAKKQPLTTRSAPGKGITPAGGNGARGGRKNAPVDDADDETDTPLPPATPTPRYYTSTSRTPDGLHMARFVGYSQQMLDELYAFTRAQHGAKPY